VSYDLFIPDNPPERSYACPGCHKGVRTYRVGNSSSYIVKDATEDKDHDCKYKGPIDNKLIGYRPKPKTPPTKDPALDIMEDEYHDDE
jgi:hypothetical protein